MIVHGKNCRLTILNADREYPLPYAEEILREAVYMLAEEASIEGDGNRRAIRKSAGVMGCTITPLTIETAPLLWALALGEVGTPLFVNETRNLYKHTLRLTPLEDSPAFSLVRERGAERIRFEHCRVSGFELRIMREAAGIMPGTLFLRLDISGNTPPEPYLLETDSGISPAERFREPGVRYALNGVENKTIYGLTVTTAKKAGTKTEVWIKRLVENPYPYGFSTSSFATQNSLNLSQPPSVAPEFPPVIESLTVTTRLFRDHYEWRTPGIFRLTLTRLLLITDETSVNSSGPVIGPLRYYCAGDMTAEVFTENEGVLV